MTRSRLVPVLLAAVLLIGAANLGAFAATGGPLLLGKGNTATKTTKLKTTGNGAALSLKSKAGKAPLKISNTTKVAKLNADLVDGADAADLRSRTYVFNLTAVGIAQPFVQFSLNGLPAGRYIVDMNVSAVIGGAPAYAYCYLVTGSGLSATAPVLVAGTKPSQWVFNGGGFLDTTAATYRFTCSNDGGGTTTIPSNSGYPAYVAFTRVDDVSAVPVTGAGSATPRSGHGGRTP